MSVTNSGRGISSQVIGSNTTTAGQLFAVNADTKSIVGIMTISSRTDGTYVLHIQHSHDGSNWETLKSGSNVTSNDSVYLGFNESVDGPCLSLIRLAIVSTAVTTGATAVASVLYD